MTRRYHLYLGSTYHNGRQMDYFEDFLDEDKAVEEANKYLENNPLGWAYIVDIDKSEKIHNFG